MEITRERIGFTFDPRDMLLPFQMGFSFVRAAVACAILERTAGLEPSSETTAPRYLKLVAVPNFCPFTFISLWMPLALFVISLVFSALSPSYTLCRFCRDFLLELLAHALPQLEHLCLRQTAYNISAAYANLRGWSGGAMVLGKLPVPGRPTSLDKSRARAYCSCSRCGWGLFGHFYSHLSFLSSFSLSLGDDPI